jgi:Fe-S-cluster containining protein
MDQSNQPIEMDEDLRLDMLNCLYEAWDRLAMEEQWACGPGCDQCCRQSRILMSASEGRRLLRALERSGRQDLINRLRQDPDPGQAAPKTTLNQFTRLYLAEQETPDESGPQGSQRACLLLEDGRCPVYQARPMACRTLLSRSRCLDGGEASLDSWWITLGTVFMQLSEALDAGGAYGNMDIVMSSLLGRGNGQGLLACEPLAGFPVPPEHTERVQEVLNRIFAEPLRGMAWGNWLDHIRNSV